VALSCQLPLNLSRFNDFSLETAKIWVEKYQSFNMTPTLHKILIHGSEIIQNSVLPVGILSEEAAESRNKFFRNDRNQHARKISRVANLTDLFNRQLDTSDPFLSSLRVTERISRHKKKSLPEDVSKLLLENENSTTSEAEDETMTETNIEMQFFIDNLEVTEFENDDCNDL
jgi:hypothetical protein